MRTIVNTYPSHDSFRLSQTRAKIIDGEDCVLMGDFSHTRNGELLEFSDPKSMGLDYMGRRIYKVDSFTVVAPSTKNEFICFASGGFLRGISSSRAEIMTNGVETLEELIAVNDSIQFPGFSSKYRTNNHNQLVYLQKVIELTEILSGYGVKSCAQEAVDVLGINALELIYENPFILGERLMDFSFRDTLKIARKLFEQNSKKYSLNQISRCAIVCCLKSEEEKGHTFIRRDDLLEKVLAILPRVESITVPSDKFDLLECLNDALKLNLIAENNGDIFLTRNYSIEKEIAENLLSLRGREIEAVTVFPEKGLDNDQRNALSTIANEPISIVTGGPGTGKTTLTRSMVKMFERKGLYVGLAAPTGQAAYKLKMATGHDAMTVHRLIGVGMSSKENAPINLFKVIIIDEASMINMTMMSEILKAIPDDLCLVDGWLK